MSGECQVNVKSLSELDIGGRETCLSHWICFTFKKSMIDAKANSVYSV